MSSNSDEINDLENEPGSDDETADDAATDLTDVIESHAPDTEPIHPDHTWAVPLSPGQVIEHHWENTIDGDDHE
jgi:hypothetical protein